jgi:hypothetical protein
MVESVLLIVCGVGGCTVVLTEAALLVGLVSVAPVKVTLAVLVIRPDAVGKTTSVIVADSLAFMPEVRVQLTVVPEAVHVKLGPLAETKFTPGGKLSVTVMTVPLEAIGPPRFVTVRLKVLLVLTVNVPKDVLVSAKSGPLTTLSVPVLLIGTPLAVAESVAVPSVLLVIVKVATPLTLVVALDGEIVSALPRSLVSTTVAPLTRLLPVSRTVTLTVLDEPVTIVIGEAATVESVALMPLTVSVALLVTETPSAVAVSV